MRLPTRGWSRIRRKNGSGSKPERDEGRNLVLVFMYHLQMCLELEKAIEHLTENLLLSRRYGSEAV